MSIIGAILPGLVGTIIISMVMMMAPNMGLPKMASWEMLGAICLAQMAMWPWAG